MGTRLDSLPHHIPTSLRSSDTRECECLTRSCAGLWQAALKALCGFPLHLDAVRDLRGTGKRLKLSPAHVSCSPGRLVRGVSVSQAPARPAYIKVKSNCPTEPS